MKLSLLAFFASVVTAEVYFEENFDSADSIDRFVASDWKKDDHGEIERSCGDNCGDEVKGQGLLCKSDMKHYAYSAKLDKEFVTKGKDTIIQFSVKHPKTFDCGGAYIKLFPGSVSQSEMKGGEGESKYGIMFGPDICGISNKKIHSIVNFNDKNLEKTDAVTLGYDDTNEYTHMYQFYIKKDDTYEIFFDGTSKASGKLEDGWKYAADKEIDDPEDKKPSDWVDDAEMDDPTESKPSDWDDEPKQISDPDAKKPEDWDDEMDGDWEAPSIDNPNYKGEWKAKRIANPDYKGVWAPKKIANPDYVAPGSDLHSYSLGLLGVEVWQVNKGVVFDNFLITDDWEYAQAQVKANFDGLVDKEKEVVAAAKKVEEEKAKADEEKRKAEEAAKAEEAKDDEDDDDDDEPEKKDDKEL